MPNYKLSEYQVKKLWYSFINEEFNGEYLNIDKLNTKLIYTKNLVGKLDDGSKRRMKRGLIKFNQTSEQIIDWVKERNDNKNYYIESMQNIKEEYYLMIRPEDNFDVLYFNNIGGINQNDPLKNATVFKIS